MDLLIYKRRLIIVPGGLITSPGVVLVVLVLVFVVPGVVLVVVDRSGKPIRLLRLKNYKTSTRTTRTTAGFVISPPGDDY